MRGRKTQTKTAIAPCVRTKNCPLCKLGQVVHKNDAYLAYQSNYYAQMRRAIGRTKNLKPKPTVGQYLHIEKALLSSKFLKKVNPAPASPKKFFSILESKWSTYGVGIFGATIMLFLRAYLESLGEDMGRRSPGSAAVLIFGVILMILTLGIIGLIDSFREKLFMKGTVKSLNSWLCLRCNAHLSFKTSKDGKPVIYLLE
jgi:hypothetical protein